MKPIGFALVRLSEPNGRRLYLSRSTTRNSPLLECGGVGNARVFPDLECLRNWLDEQEPEVVPAFQQRGFQVLWVYVADEPEELKL